jgi:anti-anti-sigma factor
MTLDPSDTPHRFALEGELTIFTAADTRQRLLDAAATGQNLEIDLAHVTEIDLAGLQLMLAVKRQALEQGKALRFVNHSAAVLDVLDLCDLAGYFGDPVVVFPSRKSEAEEHA